jgi:hypothetical protein
MPPVSETVNYDALRSTTLHKWSKTLEDTISKTNAVLNAVMKGRAYEKLSTIGDRAAFPLMYALGTADSYSGYDVLDTTPMDGITASYFDWRQASVPIAISGDEELKNAGETRIVSLLKAKTTQAEMGLKQYFTQSLLQGAGGSSITTAKTSSVNGSSFIDPLPLLVKYDPTSSTVVGAINQSTYSWWQNQTLNSTSSNYAGFLKDLRKLRNDCSKGPGGNPDLSIADQSVFELYEAALASFHRNTSYQKADIPFDNILLNGKPLVWDEYVPDVQGGSATQSTSSGTLFMLNTQFIGIKVHADRNFATTPFIKPENQDAKVAHILWYGAIGVMNRRKQGVMGGIDTTITS